MLWILRIKGNYLETFGFCLHQNLSLGLPSRQSDCYFTSFCQYNSDCTVIGKFPYTSVKSIKRMGWSFRLNTRSRVLLRIYIATQKVVFGST